MLRSAVFAAAAALALCIAPSVRADALDPALSRLRISGTDRTCELERGSTYCADQELFERLAAELSVAMAPPVIGTARTIGSRGMQLALSTTVTRVEGGQPYWRQGTEGDRGLHRPEDPRDPPYGFNESPAAALVWNHVQFRKGLPLGFEAGALLGHGMQTSFWTLGAALRWSLFEGFRTGLGQLPDVAVQAAINRSVGSSQATVQLYAFDLTLSKPFVVRQTWSVSPLLGLQLLHARVETGVIDLTPGGPPDPMTGGAALEDAYGSCRPAPGHQPTAVPPATVVCTGSADASDFANDVVFDPFDESRLRVFLGGQTRWQMFVFSASLLVDLTAPDIEARPAEPKLSSRSTAHLVAFTASLGAVL